MRVRWTRSAADDLVRIGRFIARDRPQAARRWVHLIKRKGDELAEFPMRGRSVPEFPGGGYRELVIRHYRLVYRVVDEVVEIVVVFEGHRLLDELPPQSCRCRI